MKKTILTAFIIFACLAGQAQNSKPAKVFVGVTLETDDYKIGGSYYSDNTIGFDLGVEFTPDSNKLKSFYASTSFNNYDNIIVNYSANFGMILPVRLIKNDLFFYYTPALSFIDCNNKFNFGVYNGIGFKLIGEYNNSLKIEGGFTISKYQYAFAKLIYCFK